MTDWASDRLTTIRLRCRVLAMRWMTRRSQVSVPPDDARLARMEVALANMPELTREVFMMHRFDDLPYRRIAVRVGISVDEVEAHMVTALTRLGRAARDEPL